MKRRKLSLLLCITCLVLFSLINAYGAKNSEVFHLENLEPDKAQKKINQIELNTCNLESINGIPIKTLVVGVDWIGIGLTENKIAIFSFNGKFISGINFKTGGMYELYTDKEGKYLYLYAAREFAMYMFDHTGTFVQVKGVDNEKGVGRRLIRKNIDPLENSYILKRGKGIKEIFSKGYSKVIKKDLSGTEIVFYDSNYSPSWLMAMIIVLVVIAVYAWANWMASFPEVISKWKKKKNGERCLNKEVTKIICNSKG